MLLIKKGKHTPGTRHQIQLSKNLLFKNNNIIKALTQPLNPTFGRSTITGHITVRHKGSGCKNLYKKINFKNLTSYSIILGIMHDPNRNNIICLNFDLINKTFFNTTAVLNTYVGSLIACQRKCNEIFLGYRLGLSNIPVGSPITNITTNSKHASLVRAAGTYAQLLEKQVNFCKIRLPSNQIKTLSIKSYATIGVNSNQQADKVIIGKAGINRYKGIRPSVRGIAMNPVDHPHGGRTNGGCHPMTPWGIKTKGKKTKKK